jgi:phage tail P2-like protein
MSKMLPPNATKQEQAIEQSTARIGSVPVPVGDIWNPHTCPAKLLPWLAWALSVDVWDASWSDTVKRQVIADSLPVHARKGTPWAVKRAMEAAGAPSMQISEWFEHGGAPYTFRVCVSTDDEPLTPVLVGRLMGDIDQYKNERSWGSLRISQSGEMGVSLRIASHHIPKITVLPFQIEISTTQTQIYSGVGVKIAYKTTTI